MLGVSKFWVCRSEGNVGVLEVWDCWEYVSAGSVVMVYARIAGVLRSIGVLYDDS